MVNPYKKLRIDSKIRQGEMSKIVGKTQAYISMIESGKRLPSKSVHSKYVELGMDETDTRIYLISSISKLLKKLSGNQLLAIENLIENLPTENQ